MAVMVMGEITALGDILERLRMADEGFRVFGAKRHQYRLGPPLSEGELAAFESTNRVRLPEEYRQFLSTTGNGGAGPFYGLEPLGTSGGDLSRPFPFVTAAGTLSGSELEDCDEYPGVLAFCHQGCGIHSCLVVSGPACGAIWDGRDGDFYPTGLTFAVWYRRWAERALLALDNARLLVPRLRVGMSRADVLAEVGGDWQARPALGRPVRYFEATGIPAQLELDERDFVIKINPWPFIA